MLIAPQFKGLIVLVACLLNLICSSYAFALRFDNRPIIPIPPNSKPTPEEAKNIALGKQLFNDKTLSKYNSISCASCHNLKTGGSTPSAPGNLKIPSIFNSKYNFKQFWDARANNLEAALKSELFNPQAMHFQPQEKLNPLSKKYKNKLTTEKIISALAAYINTLNTPNARFDRYLAGNTTALTAAEQKGFELFKNYGCISCHQGVLIGDNLMQKIGVYQNYFANRTKMQTFDLGYYQVTKKPNDQFVFKVPSLRNVALTAPYFHDSSVPTLNEAVEKMAQYQVGRPIPPQDVESIVQFLQTLTGTIPEQ